MAGTGSEAEAFFEQLSHERFAPTGYTRGPWDADSQHAGPPAALLGRAVLLRRGAREDLRVARMTFEILRPVPLRPLTVATRVLRAGRSVELVGVSLAVDGGTEVMRATALSIRTVPGSVPGVAPEPVVAPVGRCRPQPFFAVPWEQGYHTAMEFRFAAGSFLERGPAACWLRMRVPLVAGEKTDPLERVLVAADSINGVSNELDFTSHLFVNPDLTVNLHRHPVGDWVCIDALTAVAPDGIGTAQAGLHDERGPIGRASQSLFVAARG
ncbi:thioesterase family protein [Kitasatospora sp. NPDC050543]|uniref:thioesterase family protein n=1 Tax=Kitasatospora sp. NPDC050543 TaxID=3364054 RepID=UPI0037ABB51B